MLSAKEVLTLTELTSPVLTAYVGTDPTNKSNGKKSMSACVTWLRQAAKAVGKTLPPAEREDFRKQLNRAEEFLIDRRLKEKGIVILAGPKTWKMFPLQLKVENELHWGKPSVSQLLSLIDEEKPSLIVAIDRAGARFFRYEVGEMSEYEESKFNIDASQWKKKEHAHMAQPATEMPHGNQRDIYKQRMDAQYLHVCRGVAKRAAALAKKEGLPAIFLVGSKRLTEPIEAALPRGLRENAVLIAEDLARVSPRVLLRHIGFRMVAQTEENARRRVKQLIEGARGTVAGLDETLAQLQNGRISTVIVARGVDREMKQCVQCGLLNGSADPVCPACGGQRQSVGLSDALPELVRLHKANIEIVNGAAGERLRKVGGMGGWLRQPGRAD